MAPLMALFLIVAAAAGTTAAAASAGGAPAKKRLNVLYIIVDGASRPAAPLSVHCNTPT